MFRRLIHRQHERALFKRFDFVLDSFTKCEESAPAQYPLFAGSLEADRSFQTATVIGASA